MKSHKTLFIALSAAIFILILLLWREINSALSITTESSNEPLIANNGTAIPITVADPVLGNPGSTTEVVAFLDLDKSNNRDIYNEISAFVRSNPRDVHFIFKHAPVARFLFSDGVLAHKGIYCAGKQNKFWQFADAVASGKYNFRESGVKSAADAVGIDNGVWLDCLSSDAANLAVQKNLAEAEALDLGQPPLIFINNKKINIAHGVNLTDILTSAIQQ